MSATKVTTNFGSIHGRRIITFDVSEDGRVLRSGFSEDDMDEFSTIPARESFRRWKIARKAWQTRKFKNQLSLGI